MSRFARLRDLLKLAWPLIVANSFWNLQLTIDRIYLGQYSTDALGAAMAVMGVFWVPMALLQQTANYVTTFIAQYEGAGEHNKMGACFWQALYVSLVGGFLFLLLNWVSAPFFGWVGHSEQLQRLEVDYFNALAFSALPTALVAAVSGFFTGLGQTRKVMAINFVGLVLNAVLDPIMIFGRFGFPEMGIAGAGYATALATLGSAAFGTYLVFGQANETRYRIRSNWKFDFDLQKQFLKFGIPSGLQWALEGLAFTVFLIILGRLEKGEAALASSSIAVTVMMLSVLPSMGVAQAVMSLVGKHLGEKQPELAVTSAWDGVTLSILYISTVAFSFILFPEFYLSWFKNPENEVLWSQVSAMVPVLLKIAALFTIFDSVYLNLSFSLKGAGDTRFVSVVALLVPWPVMVLPTYLVMDWDHAVYWSWIFAVTYSMVITSIIVARFRNGSWKSMSVIHSS